MKGHAYKQLSKTIAHALRHEPELYGLMLNNEGWANIFDLLNALRRYPQWRRLRPEDIMDMNDSSPKQRFELRDDRIRALYGHSFAGRVEKEESAPPTLLFHGTSPEKAEMVMRYGLRRMNRQYVHLSNDRKSAWNVGRRKAPNPVILQIQARKAYNDGIRFFHGNEDIWLSDDVPAEFIRRDSY